MYGRDGREDIGVVTVIAATQWGVWGALVSLVTMRTLFVTGIDGRGLDDETVQDITCTVSIIICLLLSLDSIFLPLLESNGTLLL